MSKREYVIGIRPIFEAIEAGKEIEKIVFRKGLEGGGFRRLLDLATRKGIKTQFVPIEALNRVSKGNHQGVVAYLPLIEYSSMEQLVEKASAKENPLILLLDEVTDTRNFGAIARSAECAGAEGIIIPQGGSAGITAEAIKTSAGALLTLPVVRVPTLKEAVFYLKQSDFKIYSADEKSETSLYQLDFKEKVAVILGSEDRGISRMLLQLSDSTFKIPMEGEIASLNVSAAASVILFEALRAKSV